MDSVKEMCKNAFHLIRDAFESGDRRREFPLEHIGTILGNHLFKSGGLQKIEDLILYIQEALRQRQIEWTLDSRSNWFVDGKLFLGEWEFGRIALSNNTRLGSVVLVSIDPVYNVSHA